MEAILVITTIISVLLIILVYLQSAAAKANGSSILGNENVELFENSKARGIDKIILYSTGVLTTLFFIMVIMSHMMF